MFSPTYTQILCNNRQVLLNNNTVNAAADWREHGGHVLWGGVDSPGPFREPGL